MRGFCLEEILSRGVYVQGDFVWKNILRGFCQEGILSEGILSVSHSQRLCSINVISRLWDTDLASSYNV